MGDRWFEKWCVLDWKIIEFTKLEPGDCIRVMDENGPVKIDGRLNHVVVGREGPNVKVTDPEGWDVEVSGTIKL
jgi:hypothetical protein